MSYGGPPPSNGNGGFGAPPNNGGFGGPPPGGGGFGGPPPGGGGFGGGFGGPPPGGGFGGPPGGGGFSAVPATPMVPQPAKSGGAGTVLMVIGGIVLLFVGGSCLAGFFMYRRASSAVSEATAQFNSSMASAQAVAAQQQALAAQRAMAAQMGATAGSYATANPYGGAVPTPPMGMPGTGPRMLTDPTMMMNPPRVSGGLDYAAVAPIFVTNHAAMVQCFNTARSGTETIMRPQVRMSVIIRNGAVSGTPYIGTLSPTVDACIQGVIQRSAFPSSPRMTIVSMPTDLSQ